MERFNSSLYSILSGFTDGEALRIVRSEDQSFNSFEAFRKLSARFDPKTAVRGYNLVTKLSKPATCSNVSKVRDCIMSWEAEVRKYEDQSGETFPETSKMGAILNMCPQELKTHIQINGDDFTSYQQIRTLVWKYAQAVEDSTPAPMDIGYLGKSGYKGGKGKGKYGKGFTPYWQPRKGYGKSQKGKGKSKGKGPYRPWPAKGKGKGKGKGKAKGSASSGKGKGYVDLSQRTCYRCHEKGHMAANCPNRMDVSEVDWDQYEWQDTWAEYDNYEYEADYYDNGLDSFGYSEEEYWYQDDWGNWL